jgi:hypothetical protein
MSLQPPLTRLATLSILSPKGRGDLTETSMLAAPRPSGERVAVQRPGEGLSHV